MGQQTPLDFCLSDEQVETYKKQGYLVLEGFASPEEVTALKSRADELVDEFDPESNRSVFSTINQAKLSSSYFLDSASNISFFFEEKAYTEDGVLRQEKSKSINKMGHAMHDLDPVFQSFSRSPRMATVLKRLGYSRPLPVQSMYIFKQPGIGGEVVPHQDSSFLYTQPESVVGLWLAVEDADVSNGCLWALPGSQTGDLSRRMTLSEDGKGVKFDKEPASYDMEAFVPLEVKAGTLVVLHGRLVHYSKENTSPASRHAYTMHVVEGKPGVEYAPDNWLQRRPDLPFVELYAEC